MRTAIACTMSKPEDKTVRRPIRKDNNVHALGSPDGFCFWLPNMAAMAASDSSPAWAGCHEYTDVSSPGSLSSSLSARDCNSLGRHGETRPQMKRIAASCVVWLSRNNSGTE